MTTIGARTLQGTCPGGPNIRAVIRRRTTRLSDNALIDDVDLSVPTRKSVLFRRIPGPINIRTDFYYLPGKCGQYNSELAKAVRIKLTARRLSFNDNAEIQQIEDIRTRGEPRPIMADVDDFRVTHLKYIDSTQQCIRDERRILNPGHRVRTQKFWTGVTILYDKGHAPSRAPRVTLAKFKDRLDKVKDLDAGEPKAHTLHGDELDYEQKEKRKERSYSGSGKPNSISSTDWKGMSVGMRRIYIEAEREEALKRARAGEAAPSKPAGPALIKRRLLIEFACEPDSKLSATMLEQGGDAIRVHKESFDILKNKDMTRLIEIVDQNPGCDLWGSIPCGPWSTWQYVNLSQYGPEFAVELNEARRTSMVMFAAFLRIAKRVRLKGGRIAFEWPRHCLGWKQPFMRRRIDDPDIRCVDVDGCDFGMQTSDGVPIRKQWRIATSCPELANELRGRTCSHEIGYPHARIEGSLTPLTARYPIGMCKAVIKGLYGHKPYAAAPATLSEEDDAPAAPVEVTEADPCAWRRDKDALLVHMLNSYATLPTRQTPGSAGLDLSSCGEIIVPAKGSAPLLSQAEFTAASHRDQVWQSSIC